MYKSISYSHFARLTGTSEGAVRKAILRGSICKGVNLDLKKIDAEVASLEWGKPILKEFLVGQKQPATKTDLVKVAPVKKTIPVKTPVKKIALEKIVVKREKKQPETIQEFVDEIMHEKLPSAKADDLDDETVSQDLDSYIDKPEAERITSVLKAKILQITYAEKKGELLPIDKVNSVLFGYGQEIRNAFESVPDRVIDKILAVADKRHEARRILADEIQDTLELLADINSRKI